MTQSQPMTITARLNPGEGEARYVIEGERPSRAEIARRVVESSGPSLWSGFLEAIRDPARKAEFDRKGRELRERLAKKYNCHPDEVVRIILGHD